MKDKGFILKIIFFVVSVFFVLLNLIFLIEGAVFRRRIDNIDGFTAQRLEKQVKKDRANMYREMRQKQKMENRY